VIQNGKRAFARRRASSARPASTNQPIAVTRSAERSSIASSAALPSGPGERTAGPVVSAKVRSDSAVVESIRES
jgi:hypothetical protein